MGRGRKVASVLAVLMLLAGVGLLVFPYANQAVFELQTDSMRASFLDFVRSEEGRDDGSSASSASKVDVEGLYAYLKAENERLYEEGQDGLADAFSYEQPAVDLSRFGLEDNLIGFVSIPSIGSTLPIYLGANNEQMAKGAVHLTQTSYPIGTENSNAVIAAHRGTFNGMTMFRDIDGIHKGDEVIVENFRERLDYRVCEIKIIRPTDVGEVLIQDGRDMVTLITCHPLWDNYERYVVYCERVR